MENISAEELEKKLAATTDPYEWIDNSNELARLIQGYEAARAFEIAEENLSKATQLNYKKGIATAKLIISGWRMHTLDLDSCQKNAHEALKEFTELNDPLGMGQAMILLGTYHGRIKEYERSVEYLLKSMEFFEKANFRTGIAIATGNLGNNYLRLAENETALKYFLESLEIFKEIGDTARQKLSLSNISVIFIQEKQYAKALEYLFEADKIGKDVMELSQITATNNNLISYSYFKLNDVANAKKYVELALNGNPGQINKREYIMSLIIQGNIALYKKKTDDAIRFYESALQEKNAEHHGSAHDIFEGLSVAYKLKNDLARSMEYYVKFHELFAKQFELKSENKFTSMKLAHISKIADLEKNRNAELKEVNKKLNKKNRLIEKQKGKILESISYAKKIQQSVFPNQKEIKSCFPNSFILFKPKDIVSGDFYWFSQVENKIIIAAIDCTGHGVPGAFMSMIGNTLLNQIVNERKIIKPSEILDELNIGINAALHQEENSSQDGMDMSLCSFDLKNDLLEFSGAQNSIYIIHNEKGEIVKGDIFSIGDINKNSKNHLQSKYTNHSIELKKGMSVFLFTDGYYDQFSEGLEKKMGSSYFFDLLLKNKKHSMDVQKEILEKTFEQWKGENPQIDDVLVIGIKI